MALDSFEDLMEEIQNRLEDEGFDMDYPRETDLRGGLITMQYKNDNESKIERIIDDTILDYLSEIGHGAGVSIFHEGGGKTAVEVNHHGSSF